MNKSDAPVLLKVHRITKTFRVDAGMFTNRKLLLKAAEDISLTLHRGETLGLVGESGCGKTTLGRLILRLYEPDKGRIFFRPDESKYKKIIKLDEEILDLKKKIKNEKVRNIREAWRTQKKINNLQKQADGLARDSDITIMPQTRLKQIRKHIQILFQDPWSSLNPRMFVKDIITEGLKEFKLVKKKKLISIVNELLDKVGLPMSAANRYPHEFSGGQRQRIGIARALSVNPLLLICDEPLSALDVSIQAQILNLLVSLQESTDLTYLFIAHDLSVVQYISDRIAVMYLGRIVELAETEKIINNTAHPYTASLLSSIPIADPDHKKQGIILEGDVPSAIDPPSGCSFHPRCPYRDTLCISTTPGLRVINKGHFVACHYPLTYS